MSPTIIPTSIENVRGVAVQHNHKDGKVKIVLEVDRRAVDLNVLAEIESNAAIYLTIRSAQEALPTTGTNPGQMTILDGMGEQSLQSGQVFIQLLDLPTDATQRLKALKFLRKVTGLKAADLDAELVGVTTDRPYTLRNAQGGDLFPRIGVDEFDGINIVAKLHELGAKADVIEYAQEPQEGVIGSSEDVREVEGAIGATEDEQDGSDEAQEGGADLELLEGGLEDESEGEVA